MVQTVKNLPAMRETWVQSLGWKKSPEGRAWQPTPVFLSGEVHGKRAKWATVHGVTKSQT